jgi:1,4-dihydroxy-2-naphthoate octaprenyltransferase
MANLNTWILAIRPKTLPAAAGPVLVGTALAFSDQGLVILPAVCALCIAFLLQIGVNLANDYFDSVKGIDTQERLGPQRVTQSGLIAADRVRAVMWGVLGLAVVLGLVLILRGGWPVFFIGLACILAALGYSGGPYPLASHGLGDLFVFIFFGLVAVCGTYYVQMLRVSWHVFAVAAMVGLPITAIIVVNNLRDIGTDQKAGKNTLAVFLGKKGSKLEYTLLLLFAFGLPLLFWIIGWFSAWILLTWLCFPLCWGLIRRVWNSPISPALNTVLARTAAFSLLYNLLLSIGIILG